jgi:hypothetical protein
LKGKGGDNRSLFGQNEIIGVIRAIINNFLMRGEEHDEKIYSLYVGYDS